MRQLDFDKCPDCEPTFSDRGCLYYDAATNPAECGFCKRTIYYRCLADIRGIIPLSYSSVQNFLTCHQLYYLTAIRGFRVKAAMKSDALKDGTLWDAVITKYLGGTTRTGQPININDIIEENEIVPKEVAKVKAIFRAYKTLAIQVDPGADIQSKIDLKIPFNKEWGNGYPVELLVTGYYDRRYPDSFVDNKLSGRPDFYLDLFHIQSQMGTYFLADPQLKECTMEVIRRPDLKEGKTHKDETVESFEERCYQDILSRPSHYFIGWNKETKRYGKKFFRTEFDLNEVHDRYKHVFRELFEARMCNGWYKNDRVCGQILPGIPCELLPVCRYNNMSETVFEIRDRDSL